MTGATVRRAGLPRDLHPGAWWLWALGLATAASRTTNPWLLLLILTVACHVVVVRRSDAPWAMAFRLYLYLGLAIVLLRVAFRVLLGGDTAGTVLVPLPTVPLPDWVAGIQLLGDVTAEAVLAGLYDGLRLATMVVCLGAANALANPKRLLASMPGALYEVGTAVVVALSVFPQLAESVQRVRRARRLRASGGGRVNAVRTIVVPVLEDAFDRSLQLAASMDSRGYGRAGAAPRRDRAVTGTLMVTGLLGVCVGVYATLDGTAPRVLAGPVLAVGLVVAAVGFVVAGRRVERTRYRPDRWRLPELLVVASGVGTAVVLFLTSSFDPQDVYPSLTPLTWPPVATLPLVGVLLGVLPSFVAPPPLRTPASGSRATEAVR
ncbi:MAG: energy-coupling factor transporter transmembrane component T [Aeromicrobium erythreum]